eukprot:scaffold321287_cov18-Tisochrysis_lutea.AAC.1
MEFGCPLSGRSFAFQPTGVPRPAEDVTKRGVCLAYLQQFTSEAIALHGDALRVSELVSLMVRPRCNTLHCCLYELIPSEFKGVPQFFISHTWSRRVAALVAALTSFFATDDPHTVYIWLDIIAINQVPYATNKGLLQDDVSSLSKVIDTVDSTLFFLDAQGVVLTRIWCLFEVWQTL